ncbi:MAG: hypothetical protein E6J79_14350 [Deltaproteobacteria bacterium]|nr:MAG: hypothetical protein E6J79_14350 [Deltaproteobacteria bacterium]
MHAVQGYGIYASLWMHLPDDESGETYVFPPFEGANGGPFDGPLLTLQGQAIDGFVVPLAVRPGTILEVGDTFSFAAELAPTLPAAVSVVVTGPEGHTVTGRANPVGYFYDPAQDFTVNTPGVYHRTRPGRSSARWTAASTSTWSQRTRRRCPRGCRRGASWPGQGP